MILHAVDVAADVGDVANVRRLSADRVAFR